MKTTLFITVMVLPFTLAAANYQLLGWNNLGMHCMDSDYSVFSVLPPYNTIEAQLIVAGKLATNGVGYTVSYEAVADPDGSFNSTAAGKGNFFEFVLPLYGADVAPENGLTPWSMPGTNNTPQSMLFESTNHPAPGVAVRVNWFRAEGIPITPWDDAGRKNPYPLMRLVARNAANQPVATNDIVLPVSDEMDCRACHGSGTQAAARPVAGWVWSTAPERDFRLNILRLHDEHQFAAHAGLYQAALAARGFNPQGLYRGVVADGRPVLCAVCHASEALGTGSYSNIPPLTASVHSRHAGVMDSELQVPLNDSTHRAACYRCHPGSATRCLRGAMGAAIASDGTMAMQCQSCHGGMSDVGAADRVGWFMEPNCQSCHTGTATSNNGQIRYTTCFEPGGAVRVADNTTFATTAGTPAPGLSLFRFSAGHGGLQCSACHGSTHAEFPSSHRNDNLRNERIQGHAGVMVECTACHVSMPINATTAAGGPHGLHPLGRSWADDHGDLIETQPALSAGCRNCHGADGRGTVLSRMQASRVIPTKENKYGTKDYWRGRTVSCYDCHNGPTSTDPSTHPPALVAGVSANTTGSLAVAIPLSASGSGSFTYRILTQPLHGSVGISNQFAVYFPERGFVGVDRFTFTAWNGWVDGQRATGTVAVAEGAGEITAAAQVPSTWPAQWPAPFTAVANSSNPMVATSYQWDFGDGAMTNGTAHPAHAYASAGMYLWTMVAHASALATTNRGTITITEPMRLAASLAPAALIVSWPASGADAVLERTERLDRTTPWTACTNLVTALDGRLHAAVPRPAQSAFFRLRQVR